MLTENFLRGRRRRELTSEELMVIESAIAEVRDIPARRVMLKPGDSPGFSIFLIEGFSCRYMDDDDGRRQLVGLHMAGEFIDLHVFPLKYLDHGNAAISPCKIGIVPHERLDSILREMPHLTRMLWFSTLTDAAMHREWIFRIGRLNAQGRIAHLFAETEFRLNLLDRVYDGLFDFPLTQMDLAEACGMTPIHVNRTLRTLRNKGIVHFLDGKAKIQDRDQLWEIAHFNPSYLFTDKPDSLPE